METRIPQCKTVLNGEMLITFILAFIQFIFAAAMQCENHLFRVNYH